MRGEIPIIGTVAKGITVKLYATISCSSEGAMRVRVRSFLGLFYLR